MVKQSWMKCVTLHELVCFDGPSSLRQQDIHYVNISKGLMLGLANSKMTAKQKHTAARLHLNTTECWSWKLSQAKYSKQMKTGNTRKWSNFIFKIIKHEKTRPEYELRVLMAGYLLHSSHPLH